MKSRGICGRALPMVLGLALAGPMHAQSTNAVPADNFSASQTEPTQSDADAMLHDALGLINEGKYDAALSEANVAVRLAPGDPNAYGLRGSIYSTQKRWDLAEKDFQQVLALNPQDATARFNLAELDFQQKHYDAARPGFIALKTQSDDLGDLAAYKVFLCDLFGGHEEVAARELDAFNQVGSNASYYFGNLASSLYHGKTEEARGWLTSGIHIFSQRKIGFYTASLKSLGYLPLPPPAN